MEECTSNAPIVVVGYSGENDPVYLALTSRSVFGQGLYWIGYRHEPPGSHVRDTLLSTARQAFWVPGYDSDRFFVALLRALGSPPPVFLTDPFQHMEELLADVENFPDEEERAEWAINGPRSLLSQARRVFTSTDSLPTEEERQAAVIDGRILARVVAGDFESAVSEVSSVENQPMPVRRSVALAYNNWGTTLARNAIGCRSDAAGQLLTTALEKFEAAHHACPSLAEPLYNAGLALAERAKRLPIDERASLYDQAIGVLRRAHSQSPTDPKVMMTLASVLGHRATDSVVKDDTAFDEALRLFEEAVGIEATRAQIWNNWGLALAQRSDKLQLGSWRHEMENAISKFRRALTCDDAHLDSLMNLGRALTRIGQRSSPTLVAELLTEADGLFARATLVGPDNSRAWRDWGRNFYVRGMGPLETACSERVPLLTQAAACARRAAELNEEDASCRSDRALALARQAEYVDGGSALQLYELADSLFREAIRLDPNGADAQVNLASVLLDRAEKFGDPTYELTTSAQQHAEEAVKRAPGLVTGHIVSAQALAVRGISEGNAVVLEEAAQRCRHVVRIQEDSVEGWHELARILIEKAACVGEGQRDRCLSEAAEALERATSLRPEWPSCWSTAGDVARRRGEQNPSEANRFFAESRRFYEKALSIAPTSRGIRGNAAVSLLTEARVRGVATEEGKNALHGATELFTKLLEEEPDDHRVLYNMACTRAVAGDVPGCLELLTRRAAIDPPLSPRELRCDPDFEQVQSDCTFQIFLAELERRGSGQ